MHARLATRSRFRTRTLRIVQLGFAVLVAALMALSAQSGGPPIATANWDNETAAFLNLINDYRAQNGRGPLTVDAKLQAAADWMSNDQLNAANCIDRNNCSHRDTQGRDIGPRIWDGFGYPRGNTRIGENIAWGFQTAQQVFEGWRNSPGHNANMLEGRFTATGIGRLCRDNGPCFWTNTFGSVVSEPFNGPTAPTGPAAPVQQEIPAPVQPWVGTWNTDRGQMRLAPPQAFLPTESPLFGQYSTDGSTVEGGVFGNMFSGTWFGPPRLDGTLNQGDFEFTLSADGNSFTGRFRIGASETWEPWNGTRAQ
jgi:uncharacterized protein YkwD